MPCITLHCITSKVFVQIGLYLGKCFMKNQAKEVRNDCYVNWGLSFGAKLGAKIKRCQRAWPRNLIKMGHKNAFFNLNFWHLLGRFKKCNIYLVLICITGKILLKLELIKARMSSFRLSSAHLNLMIWVHLGKYWAQIGSFWIYLGSFELF